MILQKRIESKLGARIIEIAITVITAILVLILSDLILRVFGYSIEQLIDDISEALFW